MGNDPVDPWRTVQHLGKRAKAHPSGSLGKSGSKLLSGSGTGVQRDNQGKSFRKSRKVAVNTDPPQRRFLSDEEG